MLPRDYATDQSFCPKCGEPCDELNVEAFEVLDIEVCQSCGVEALECDAEDDFDWASPLDMGAQ